ncbi:zinc-dependent peptidase [Candidatus Marimicrobium litorale]|uniref:Zinc-dependent peptidase n=1 Tax=Candidatus Marimicrobium litorale TaxID=2518991 RepID=A0ABT3T2I2_9GAMM|nr:zinc-dependent peptidase [Candidatus Marimicrobium litorale]MCX2975734.1 zinc-dependent peptidase [Candidatus Marimicrobium litorale]
MENSPGLIGLLPIALVIGVYLLVRFYRRWKEKKILVTPLPRDMIRCLEGSVPFYIALDLEAQERLRVKIKRFLAEKTFYGCAGLVITDDMQLIIAAEACLLILNQEGQIYPGLTSILVYPSTFVAKREELSEDGTRSVSSRDLLGESWDTGKVVLAWDAVAKGVADFADGNNVVLHEFAHQLDSSSGRANGAPPLSNNSYKNWARVLSANYEDLRLRSQRALPTVIDTYGATNPAEFFAVATETFFERPHELHHRRPELFEQLSIYYRLDPRDWAPREDP